MYAIASLLASFGRWARPHSGESPRRMRRGKPDSGTEEIRANGGRSPAMGQAFIETDHRMFRGATERILKAGEEIDLHQFARRNEVAQYAAVLPPLSLPKGPGIPVHREPSQGALRGVAITRQISIGTVAGQGGPVLQRVAHRLARLAFGIPCSRIVSRYSWSCPSIGTALCSRASRSSFPAQSAPARRLLYFVDWNASVIQFPATTGANQLAISPFTPYPQPESPAGSGPGASWLHCPPTTAAHAATDR